MTVIKILSLVIHGAAALRILMPAGIQKIPIWVYYDTMGNHGIQEKFFGNLTFESIEQRMDHDEFELKLVTSQNVKDYIPDIPQEFFRLYDAAKSDFLRAALITKHGGIFMDADIFMNMNFHDLWQELQKRQAGFLGYVDPGQTCKGNSFTTNFMMGLKDNQMTVQWLKRIMEGLQSRCQHANAHDDRNGVCCYNPDGSTRHECHIPWGSLSRPMTQDIENVALGACLDHDMTFSIDDMTGEMLWRPFVADESLAKSDTHCWIDGPDMVCKDGKRMPNAMKRPGYHLHSTINFKQRGFSRNDIMSSNRTVASIFFRYSLLGEDISDVPSFAKSFGVCYDGVVGYQSATKPLSFIHIPRTGGTAVEECTQSDPHEKWGVQNPDLHGLYKFAQKKHGAPFNAACYKQHVPPSLFYENESPYAGKETFCIVRDPYDRMISQFRFELTFYREPTQCNKKELNAVIKKRLIGFKDGQQFAADCHYVPQSAYVFGMNTKSFALDVHRTSCNHVLKFENLHEQANELFAEHKYPYKLTDKPSAMTGKRCNLAKADLDHESLRLIEEIYHDDFDLFGYAKHDVSQ